MGSEASAGLKIEMTMNLSAQMIENKKIASTTLRISLMFGCAGEKEKKSPRV